MARVPKVTLAQVKLTAEGALSINGQDIPHVGVRLDIRTGAGDLPTLTVELPIIEFPDIKGKVRVMYIVHLDALHPMETIDASGHSVPAALRALADKVEAQ